MRYSFVIPTHNNKVSLRKTLAALNLQNDFGYGDYEVVVVDDGSTDGTYDYIKGINKNYELRFFYLERCAESCRSRTRNYGWRKAAGEIIVFIDSDIIVHGNHLRELERCFSASMDIMVIGNRIMLNQPIEMDEILTGKAFAKYGFDSKNLNALDFRHMYYEVTSYNSNAIMCPWIEVYSCNLAVPKEWLNRVGGFDENFKDWGLEDVELGYALYKENVQIVINSKLEVLHQYHGERDDLVIKGDKLPGYERNIEYFLDKHPNAVGLRRHHAYKLLKGGLSVDKMLINTKSVNVQMELNSKDELPQLKERIQYYVSKEKAWLIKEKVKLTILDHVEDTDLDVWIQLLGRAGSVLRYYPSSKRIDIHAIIEFLKREKSKQLEA